MATVLLEKDDKSKISIRFDYRPELVAKIKEIKGRSWHPEKKYWTVPDNESTLDLLCAIFQKEG